MDFTSVQRAHVEQALADLAAGVSLPGFRDSTTYDVVHQGRPFPPKLLIALALKYATGQVVTGDDFGGGEGTACFRRLRELGFLITEKIESGRDETLTLATIRAYAEASQRPIAIHFGRPMTHVEAVRQHAAGIRHHLEALAALAHKDEATAKDIGRFFREATRGLDQVISRCRERLPKSAKVEVHMQTLVPLPPSASGVSVGG